ncbi:MAG: P22 phage major capsid protein family protein, partial [Pseudomonadota bacterium]
MANNSLLTIDMITKETLRVAHETSQFIKTTDTQYDAQFAKEGAKIGSALRVRKPNKYVRTQGTRQLVVQDQNEQSGTLTVATQDHVGMSFYSSDLAMSIDDFSKRYITPAVKTLISGIESDYIAFCTKATWNVAGTAGTALTDLVVPSAARAKLNQGLAPKDGNRYVQCESVAMGGLVNGLKGLFQDSTQIKEQYREGMIGRTGMADWYENERMWTMPNSADVAGEINAGSLVNGITSLTVDGFSAAPVAGMVFTIEGTYAINPETKAQLPHLQQFVCSAGCTTTNLIFTPAVYWDSTGSNAALQNCTGQPSNDDDITFVGSASANYVQQLMYHKEAFQFVSADLPIMSDASRCSVQNYEGISMRVWEQSDI